MSDDKPMFCPRCGEPVTVVQGRQNGHVFYWCKQCWESIDHLSLFVEDEEDEVPREEDWRPEFQVTASQGAWVFAALVVGVILMLVGFCGGAR